MYTVNNKKYVSSPELFPSPSGDPCYGCAFQFDTVGCDIASTAFNCTGREIIFIDKELLPSIPEPKLYTVKKVLLAIADYFDVYGVSFDHYTDDKCKYLEEFLDKNSDPEYKEYIRLKSKFEDK